MNHTSDITPIYITDNLCLKDACEKLLASEAISLDTEFIRTNTFYPIPALLQLFDGTTCYLIDPLSIDDLSPLVKLLNCENTVKVLHSCSEDLEVFDRLCDTLPQPLFDTQIASAFLGYGFSVGYSKLVKEIFDVDIPKEETRSDWLQRPLSASQIKYAVLDVVYLFELYEIFQKKLQRSEKQDWVQACNQELIWQYHPNQEPENYFHRLKNAWRLSPDKQHLIRQLCQWREQTARNRNRPRNHILKDADLQEIALAAPTSIKALKNISALTPRKIQQYGESLVSITTEFQQGQLDVAEPLFSPPLPREVGPLLKDLKQQNQEIAEQLGIAPEMLARKKDIQSLVSFAVHPSATAQTEASLPDSLKGWRRPIIGDALLETAKQWQKNN